MLPARWGSSAPSKVEMFPATWGSSAPNVAKVTLNAYCLAKQLDVPAEGVVFRIADLAAQRAHSSMRAILKASRLLNSQGQLNPDSDSDQYFHSIRQWAIWAEEEGYDEEAFVAAFIEHTRKNFEAAERQWTKEVEELVRSLVPNRWEDIQRILQDAARM